MNKKLLGSAIAAALGISFAGTATALDLDTGVGTTLFMEEMDVDTNGVLQAVAGSTGSLNTTHQLGFGFAADNSDIYIRYDLSNGATWSTNLTAENLNTTGCSTISLSAGGTTSDNYVIFNVTGGEALSQTEGVTLDLNDSVADTPTNTTHYAGVKVINKNPVTITYGLYTTPTNAIDQANPISVASREGILLDFSPVLGLSGSTTPATAEVIDDFKRFSGAQVVDTGVDTIARIGTVTFAVNTVFKRDLTAATAADAGATATSELTITGDFGAAASVALNTNTDCASGTNVTGTIAGDGLSASFVVGEATPLTYYVCFTADTENTMAEGIYTGAYLNLSDQEVGEIIRNGVELLAPFFTVHPLYTARFYLTNTSTKNAPFTVEVQTDQGVNGQDVSIPSCVLAPPYDACVAENVDGNPCMIPASSNLLIKGNDLLAGGQRCSATFRIAASAEDVHGHFATRSQTTLDFDSYLMISIGSNSGH